MFKEGVKSGYFMYMAEQTGMDNLVNSRSSKINSAIKDFKFLVRQGKNPNDYIDTVLAKYGLSEDMLTDRECERIMGDINGLF